MELMINVANAEAIAYTTEELGFTILGGIRLDRLKVTVSSCPFLLITMP